MRVLHVVPYLPKISGVTTYVDSVTGELVRSGIQCEVAVADWNHKGEGITIVEGVPRLVVEEALAKLRGNNYDLLHMHGIWPPFMHRFVTAALRSQTPIIWSIHGMLSPWAKRFKWWKKLPVWLLWQKRDLARSSIMHVTSEIEKKWIEAYEFGKPVAVSPLGTYLPPFESAQRKEGNSDKKILLFAGRIAPIKALPNLMSAWATQKMPGWTLRIVGEETTPGYKNELVDLCLQLRISDSVEFAGARFGDELNHEYCNANALALVSETENFGAVVADAMAHCLPVITSKGTPWQCVDDEKCGWWVDNDVESLSRVLGEMRALPDSEMMAMGMRGRSLVEKQYSWQAIALEMKSVYECILKGC